MVEIHIPFNGNTLSIKNKTLDQISNYNLFVVKINLPGYVRVNLDFLIVFFCTFFHLSEG